MGHRTTKQIGTPRVGAELDNGIDVGETSSHSLACSLVYYYIIIIILSCCCCCCCSSTEGSAE